MSEAIVTRKISRRSDEAEARLAHAKRLFACLGLGFMLALMVGPHEGTQDDFGYAFRQAVAVPRIFLFLGIGVLVYLAITFWPRLVPYLKRPGMRPLTMGALTVVAGIGLLNWTDSPRLTTGKFSSLAPAAAQTGGLDAVSRMYFGYPIPGFAWLLLVLVAFLGVGSIVRQSNVLAWSTAGLAIVAGVWGFFAQSQVIGLLGTADHATGPFVAFMGYLTIACAAAVNAYTSEEEAHSREFINKAFDWRPGFPLVVVGTLGGLLATLWATWFSPTNRDDGLFSLPSRFAGSTSGLASAYYTWLIWPVFIIAVALAAYACFKRSAALGWAAFGVGILAALLNLYTMHNMSSVGAAAKFDGAVAAWDNLGVGGWLMAGAFGALAGAGWVAATRAGRVEVLEERSSDEVGPSKYSSPNVTKVLLVLIILAALFYPPTASQFWQTVLVTQIGIYVLLAIGLNVVVGWAGLLDLGFIAFYAIGSYTTAYLTGRLPVQPPSWLHMSPLTAIPFAIVICLIAGVMLGSPTLRLRGDYLAIVTLGFGEIIRQVSNIAEEVTNGSRGAFNIPKPSINIGPIHIQWGTNVLQYWYLLLFMIVVVVVLFRRLEDSRLGRAWAAIREDEVAAQATGINTFRAKLLAFAIGASTSGVAGVFFASLVGSFTPENFILNYSILIVAYVVFGGMGSLPGAMAGAAALTWLPEFLKEQVPSQDRQMWIGVVILLMMIFRPSGLIPAQRRKKELSGLDRPDTPVPAAVPAKGAM